jgi:transcriptional antiterminator NusG
MPGSRQFYAIQVTTGGEEKFLKLARRTSPTVMFLWPRRSLRIRRRGRWTDTLAPIFSGYVFILADRIEPELYWSLRKTPGFFRFLKSNQDIVALPEGDARVLRKLLAYGEVVGKSVADFDENNRIRVLDGPLKGLEGQIVKVDRRKGRVKVKLDLYEESHTVDFGFTSVEAQ